MGGIDVDCVIWVAGSRIARVPAARSGVAFWVEWVPTPGGEQPATRAGLTQRGVVYYFEN